MNKSKIIFIFLIIIPISQLCSSDWWFWTNSEKPPYCEISDNVNGKNFNPNYILKTYKECKTSFFDLNLWEIECTVDSTDTKKLRYFPSMETCHKLVSSVNTKKNNVTEDNPTDNDEWFLFATPTCQRLTTLVKDSKQKITPNYLLGQFPQCKTVSYIKDRSWSIYCAETKTKNSLSNIHLSLFKNQEHCNNIAKIKIEGLK
jgi:hypothetical protein